MLDRIAEYVRSHGFSARVEGDRVRVESWVRTREGVDTIQSGYVDSFQSARVWLGY